MNSWEFELDILQAVVIAFIQITAVVHILISKQNNPSQAAFWLLLVTLLPGIGLICYLFFGITFFEHVSNAIARSRSMLNNSSKPQFEAFAGLQRSLKDFQISAEYSQTPRMQLFDRLFPEHPALQGNTLEMLKDGIMVYPRMLEDIKPAQSTIRLQSFILNSDEVGQKFMDALAERAAAGVDVKVLFDSVGSFKSYFSQYFRKKLRRSRKNFRIKSFSPVNVLAPWKFQLRNHRKLLVVDGKVAYVGGINISSENTRIDRIPPQRYIHDLHCRITGPAVAQFTLSFLTDYFYSGTRKKLLCSGDSTPVKSTGEAVVRVIPGGPGNTREATRKLFFAAAALAQKELWILTPYFVPGHDYVESLCMAAARGVDVRIVLPAINNHFYMDCAAKNFYERLHNAGVRIYEKLGVFSHTKALLVDSEWGFMGSSNCDSRSFYLNFELDFLFEKSNFVNDIHRQFHEEFSGARQLTGVRLRHTGKIRKLLNSAMALFTPIL